MNAALFLLTTALATGHGSSAPACNSPACSAPAPACNSCNSCDPCESRGHRLFGRFQGLFKFHSCNSCKTECDPCPKPEPCPAPKCEPVCDPCAGHGHGHNLFSRFRGFFHRNNDCCESTCDSCATSGCAPAAGSIAPPATGGAPPATGGTGANPVPEPPKKLPANTPPPPAKGKSVQLDSAPPAPLAVPTFSPVIQTRPANVIAAPSSLRNPF